MDFRDYSAFVPAAYTADMTAPSSTWWQWRGRRVHIARAAVPEAAVRVMVIHGGGGYSGALWPAAAVAAGEGVDVLAPDLPLYGDTEEPHPSTVRYDDWVELLCDLARAERAADPRPLILFGASMGGMLAYEVAARTELVAAVVATCLLDMSDPAARAAATRFAWMGRPAPALLRAIDPVVGRLRLPIRWLADMTQMSTDPRLSRLCASDPRGGGVSVPLGFVAGWMNYSHTAPESFAAAPVTLVAPDTWTPPELSIRFLQRISGPTKLVMLENCGHYPIEEPGLTQLRTTMRETVRTVAVQAHRP
ncbi:alpha/beta hydrolase [Mycolicibacterium pyrenivorans]|uniref:alpha/beta hydrolase n=1 Tax=Mycolicibacterium pyrenivorans TaxID=187102 RepID=UPI0021F36EDF|nr:alpha/beta hydrolase [Mycolicibacterium pyrenivorans]MCV7150418.1 alpha/beta hydrolase [Mycolicibacterium pyrenivorans]